MKNTESHKMFILDSINFSSINWGDVIVLSKLIHFNTIEVSKELFWALIDSDMIFLQSLLTYLSKDHSVIVEGVETKQQLDFIAKIKGIKIQGYYFNPQLESINE